jgi:hypothetical protein
VLHVIHAYLDTHEQHDLVFHNIQRLFVHRHCFSCFMKGLNGILLIYMGSSFGEDVEGWAGITCGKFLCVTSGAKLFCVVDMGSWCLSCQSSKNLLLHPITCAMDWLNVERFGKVSNKSFTSPCNPNSN